MSTSLPISGPYPGLTYNPGVPESPSIYAESREINETMYFAINAYFDGSIWHQKDTHKASYAVTQNKDNSFGHLSQAAGIPTWTDWQGTDNITQFHVGDYGMSPTNTGPTNQAALLAALTAAANAGGGIVWIPSGSYRINKTVTLDNTAVPPFPDVGIIIAAAGGSTELIADPDADGTLYDMFSIIGMGSGRGIRFQDIRISYPMPLSLPTTTPVAIRVTSGQNVTSHRMYFHNCFTAMYLDKGALECGVFDSTITYNNWGYGDKSSAPGLLFLGGAENYVLNCIISQTPGIENVVGIIVSPAGGAIFIANSHISDFTIGIWIQAGGVNLARVFGSNVICESLTSSLYIVPILMGAKIYQVYFSDCSFGAASGSAEAKSSRVCTFGVS